MAKHWDVAQVSALVNQIYNQVMGRGVLDNNGSITDPSGLFAFGCALRDGNMSVRDTVRSLGLSQEYFNRFIVPLTVADGINQCYVHFLGRQADQGGLQNYEQGIRNGGGFNAVINSLIDSDEYTKKFGADVVP